jgi:hypothetical protein
LIEGLSDNFGAALIHLSHLLPILVEAMNRWGPRLYQKLDKAITWIRDVLNRHTPAILAMINSWPQFSHWLSDIYEPAWGTQRHLYPTAGGDFAIAGRRHLRGSAAAPCPGRCGGVRVGQRFGSGHPRPDRSRLRGRAAMTRRPMCAARVLLAWLLAAVAISLAAACSLDPTRLPVPGAYVHVSA